MTGADSIATLAVYIGMLGMDFTVTEPADLVDELRTVSERYAKAIPVVEQRAPTSVLETPDRTRSSGR